MEYRKLIRFGNSSHVISLPSNWIKKNNLKKGDILNFYENKNNEIIVSLNIKRHKISIGKANVEIDGKDLKRIRREIVAAYLQGYNSINIIGNIRNNRDEIRTFLDNLMGFEIVEQNKTTIIAKDFMDLEKFSVENALRKMDLSVRMIFSEFKQFGSKISLENIKIYDKDINRYTFLFRRIYKIALETGTKELFGFTLNNLLNWWEVSHHTERIGARLKTFYEHTNKIKDKKINKNLILLIKDIEKYYLDSMKCYYSKNIDYSYKLSMVKHDIILPKFDKFKNGKSKDLHLGLALSDLRFIVSSIHRIIRRIYN